MQAHDSVLTLLLSLIKQQWADALNNMLMDNY